MSFINNLRPVIEPQIWTFTRDTLSIIANLIQQHCQVHWTCHVTARGRPHHGAAECSPPGSAVLHKRSQASIMATNWHQIHDIWPELVKPERDLHNVGIHHNRRQSSDFAKLESRKLTSSADVREAASMRARGSARLEYLSVTFLWLVVPAECSLGWGQLNWSLLWAVYFAQTQDGRIVADYQTFHPAKRFEAQIQVVGEIRLPVQRSPF
ncbi:hypothetical protein B0H17DRAFT_1138996 [Mycena rosella]|uniref:Uncharacterized protein n=1 Tax=Mycena rosella TaxID=1033263 RepID=A0AAD7D5B2_MYCRO|nr:hypothetical protein B0H17DRAFT_1138996 [Mycena rosella]